MYVSKNCYYNIYCVMILKVLIKSNYIPTCFGGSHHHHQRSSLYKLKHHIIKNCPIMHTLSDSIRTFKIFITCILLENFLGRYQTGILWFTHEAISWISLLGIEVNLPPYLIKYYKMKLCGEAEIQLHTIFNSALERC
jgi:hypothetical protein